MKRINCKKCIYYYITWDSMQPHGCKAYGFKSKAMPSMIVKQSSQVECSFFTIKPSAK